jgi:hypothetical protein
MSLEKAVRATLVADSTVLGLVASRIYPQRRPQGTSLPALVYMNVHSHQTESLQTQTGIRRTRLAIESIGATYGSTKTLRDAVESALVNYTGTLEGETIYSIRLESVVDIDESTEPGSQFGAFRTIMDFVIWHE